MNAFLRHTGNSSTATSGSSTYRHIKFTETSHPELALIARRIQAESYREAGFVKYHALDADGQLAEDLDLSRGAHTDYYLSINENNPRDRATIRINNIPPGASYRQLPGYHYSRGILSASGEALLEDLHRSGTPIREIAALGRSRGASPMSILSLIRHLIHEARHSPEVWMMTTVRSTHDFFVRTYGTLNFSVLGSDAELNDQRVHSGLALCPSLTAPDVFIDNLSREVDAASYRVPRLERSLTYLREGLDDLQPGQHDQHASTIRYGQGGARSASMWGASDAVHP